VDPEWVRHLRDRAVGHGVPFFFKLLCTIEVLGGECAVPIAAYSRRVLARAA
jgi:hypothetical protein